MDTNKKIVDYWSLASDPRQIQLDTFSWLEQNSDKKYLIVELPVGSGKSNIGVTYSAYLDGGLGNSFILTPQRILQEQYEKSFDKDHIFSLYGRRHYSCHDKNTTCDVGGMIKPRCDFCPHRNAKDAAKVTPNVVLNYKLALLNFAYTDQFTKRKLMVLDECHVLEQELVDFDAISVGFHKATKYGITWSTFNDIFEAHEWIKEVYFPALDEKFAELQELTAPLLNQNNLTPDEIHLLKEFKKTEEHHAELDFLTQVPTKYLGKHYVLVHDKLNMTFKQLYARNSFARHLEPMAEKFLFMSSTILDYKGFCRDLGINPDEAAFLSLQSEFPAENRPVYYIPVMKMNASWMSDENRNDRRNMINLVEDLLVGEHNQHKGIIHTASFTIAEYLVDELNKLDIPHIIMHHNPDSDTDRNKVINRFIKCKDPAVLISPSITEGLDLIGDLARFAIFFKTPFGFLGDQWIKTRMDLSSEWYQRQAMIQIIQGGGRIVRSKDDWGNVYILDGSFGYLYNQLVHNVPRWWKDAYLT